MRFFRMKSRYMLKKSRFIANLNSGLARSAKSSQAYVQEIISLLHWLYLERPLSRFRYEKIAKNINPFSILQICRIHKISIEYRHIHLFKDRDKARIILRQVIGKDRDPEILEYGLAERHQAIDPNSRFPWAFAIAAHRFEPVHFLERARQNPAIGENSMAVDVFDALW